MGSPCPKYLKNARFAVEPGIAVAGLSKDDDRFASPTADTLGAI
jgi:hypothetical protein